LGRRRQPLDPDPTTLTGHVHHRASGRTYLGSAIENPELVEHRATESVGSAFGRVLASLGRPTNGIGLAAISSEV
jgi:hypothetical protein